MRPDPRELAAIFVGGFAGAVLRAQIAERLADDPGSWPWETLLVNIAGAFLLGWLITRRQGRLARSGYGLPLLGTGFCGALTTFSALQLELLFMLDAGHAGLALTYALVSAAAGYAAVLAATTLARSSDRRRL